MLGGSNGLLEQRAQNALEILVVNIVVGTSFVDDKFDHENRILFRSFLSLNFNFNCQKKNAFAFSFLLDATIDHVGLGPLKVLVDVNHLPAAVYHHLGVVDERVLDQKSQRVLVKESKCLKYRNSFLDFLKS